MEVNQQFNEMSQNDGQWSFSDDYTLFVYVAEKNEWFTCDKKVTDFIPDGNFDAYDAYSDEVISYHNYIGEQWDYFRK
jgi:hypothetical protein